MHLIDAQVHVWDRDHPGRPWDPGRQAAREKLMGAEKARQSAEDALTYQDMIVSMDAVGVDAAVLVTTSHYGTDPGYSVEAAAAFPDRFAVVHRLVPTAPDVVEQVQRWKEVPGAIGLRALVMTEEQVAHVHDGVLDPMLAAAGRAGLPVSLFPPHHLAEVGVLAARHPEVRFVVDHLGMSQPPLLPADEPPMRTLPELLDLAHYPNVAVKLTAAPVLAGEPFPFRDLWPAVHRIIEAFGVDRLMWGTDWQRVRPILSYDHGVRWFTESTELSDSELRALGGDTLRAYYRWSPSATTGSG